MSYDNLQTNGFVVIRRVLELEECKILKDNLIKATTDLVFSRQGYEVSPDDPNTVKMFTNINLRRKKFGEKGENIVWRDGNSRNPLISKSTGMVDIHFNEALLEMITLNPILYEKASKIMGTDYLVHAYGPERFCIKAPGAEDMPQHIDSNLFCNDLNYKFRIQSLVNIEIDNKISPRDSGTICLLTYFHHYWDFAGELFHPFRGLFPMKQEVMNSRFFVLPSDKKNEDDFNRDYLPKLKKYALIYSELLKNKKSFYPLLEKEKFKNPDFNLDKCEQRFFAKIMMKNITIPEDNSYIEKMDWEPVSLNPGDMIFWHQYLPHKSLRNRSKNIPRICAYYSLFPVEKGWYGSQHQIWVEKQFSTCEFYYGGNSKDYPTKPINLEELEMMKKKGIMDKIIKMTNSSQFVRRITGQESWWEEETKILEPADIKDLCESMIRNLTSKMNTKESPEEEIVHKIIFVRKYWAYVPNLISDENIFLALLPQLKKVCKSYNTYSYGKKITYPRISVLYGDFKDENSKNKITDKYYRETSHYNWEESPLQLSQIKETIESFFEIKVDYVLCHIYRGLPPDKNPGSDYIGWHNDKEALDSNVISVSLGASRRFQFCKIDGKEKVCSELILSSGDVLHMYGPRGERKSCQRMFKHRVPPMTISDLVRHIETYGIEIPKGRKTYETLNNIIKENNIIPDRINLTFRQFEN